MLDMLEMGKSSTMTGENESLKDGLQMDIDCNMQLYQMQTDKNRKRPFHSIIFTIQLWKFQQCEHCWHIDFNRNEWREQYAQSLNGKNIVGITVELANPC